MIYKVKEEDIDLRKLEVVTRIWKDYEYKHMDVGSQRIHIGYYFEYQVHGQRYNTLPAITRLEIDKLRADLIRQWQKSKGKK